MQTRIEFCQNGTGFVWFLDVRLSSGWKNIASFKTKAEATEAATVVALRGASF